MSWRCLQDVFARRLEGVLKTSWQDVLKMSWRRLENVLKTSWRRFCKTSWKHLENVLKKYGQDEYIGFDQDVLKTSSEDVWLIRIYLSSLRSLEDVLKTSFEDENERRLQEVFIKTNICWLHRPARPQGYLLFTNISYRGLLAHIDAF